VPQVPDAGGEKFGILLIDLDRFKLINDNFGHDAGDATLVEIGSRLLHTVRECDVISRIGGDEFVILLPETSDEASIDAICRRVLEALNEPVMFHEHRLNTNASMGVALFPDHATIWQYLYKAADIAVYHAKRAGRRTWRWYALEVSTEPRV
jgi:diguanylate cyclase (GGDEF)-like protein